MSNDAVKDELIKNVAELVAFMQSGMQSGVEFMQQHAPNVLYALRALITLAEGVE